MRQVNHNKGGRAVLWNEDVSSGGGGNGNNEKPEPLHKYFAKIARAKARTILFREKQREGLSEKQKSALNQSWEKIAEGGASGTLHAYKIILARRFSPTLV